jgi:phosphate transport system ATP-binding protein
MSAEPIASNAPVFAAGGVNDGGVPVTVDRLSIAYGRTTRVADVSLHFAARSISALLGPSGCGKSTLLRALNRTLELVNGGRVTQGTVRAGVTDLYAPGVSAGWVRTQVGMLQQKPAAFPMSIIDNVLFGARYHRLVDDPLACCRAALERVGLWSEVHDRLNTSALRLSGGQQQRLCLARTLATRPRVILMDEPCSALDPRSTAVIESLARELAAEFTLIIVTHNVSQARRLAPRSAFMDDGRVLADGPTEEILDRSAHPALRAYLATA